MEKIKKGDIVARKSYKMDIFFKVHDIIENDNEENNKVVLKGISYRIEADASFNDLVKQKETAVRDYRHKTFLSAENTTRKYKARTNLYKKKPSYRGMRVSNEQWFKRPGSVLHIDGDEDYLETCLLKYKELGIMAEGFFYDEKKQPENIIRLLREYNPDILVITGHDGFIKKDGNKSNIDNYWNSKYFIKSAEYARRQEKELDNLVIFAGACQSMYKKIMQAGANFASSPERVLIHALDPVFVSREIAYTPVSKIVNPQNVIEATITGEKGIGGVETRGKYRKGFPLDKYQ